MRIVRPYAVTDGNLTTNATESVAAWSSVTAYTTGQTVSYGHKVWEAVQNGTNKQPDINPLYWFELRPTNPWAMFDNKTGTQTVRGDDLTVTVDVDGYADTVGLLNISASTLNVKVRAPTPERTNILLWSEDFSNVSWGKIDTSVTANAITAPDGTMTADKLVEDASTASHSLYQGGLFTDEEVTFSIFVKAGERSYVALETSNFSTGGSIAMFDLAAGTAWIVNVDPDFADPSFLIEDYQNGWYRCSISAFKGHAVNSNVWCIARMSADGGSLVYAGDGTSGLYVWGAQLETGTEPTEYIPTTSAPASSTSTQIFNEDIPLVDETAVTDYYEYFFEPIIRLTDVVVPLPPDIFSPSITVKLEDAGEDVKAGHMIAGKSRYIGEAIYGATIGITDYSRIEEDDFGNTYIAERGYNRRGRFNVWMPSSMVDAVYNIVSSYRATPIMVIATEQFSSTLYFGLLREAEIEIAYPSHSIMSVEVRGL